MKITIESIIHATEDDKKIVDSISKFLYVETNEFYKQNLNGHFNNPIILLRAKISGDRVNRILSKILSNISKFEIENMMNNLKNKINGSSLYLRLGKQELINGVITMKEKNSVKIIINDSHYKKNTEKSFRSKINELINKNMIKNQVTQE